MSPASLSGTLRVMRFVDLFAGLGGFHMALARLGHRCVMASEIDPELVDLYERNHGIRPLGDLRSIDLADVPVHDVLCAGFPCQPFSKAGLQQGRACPAWGDLFDHVLAILRVRRPGYLILENVPNLLRHRRGATWSEMRGELEALGYDVDARLQSPHMFGVPQARDRAIIVGALGRSSLASFSWPGRPRPRDELDLRAILDERPNDARPLPEAFERYLDVWQRFLDMYPEGRPLPSFPVWAMEFGASYPFEETTPAAMSFELDGYRGTFGEILGGSGAVGAHHGVPSYARAGQAQFPRWKRLYIRQNRELYAAGREAFDAWLPSVRSFAPSFQKLDWNWKDGPRDIRKGLIQFRASGIRVKRPTVAPSLVAFTTSQVPVIPWESRYITPRECARLQSIEGLRFYPASRQAAYRALGNAVNVTVVQSVAERLLQPASQFEEIAAE